MLLAAFDLAAFLPFALFGAFAALAWFVLERVATPRPRAEQRLEEFKDPSIRKRKDGDGQNTAMTRVLEAAARFGSPTEHRRVYHVPNNLLPELDGSMRQPS